MYDWIKYSAIRRSISMRQPMYAMSINAFNVLLSILSFSHPKISGKRSCICITLMWVITMATSEGHIQNFMNEHIAEPAFFVLVLLFFWRDNRNYWMKLKSLPIEFRATQKHLLFSSCFSHSMLVLLKNQLNGMARQCVLFCLLFFFCVCVRRQSTHWSKVNLLTET